MRLEPMNGSLELNYDVELLGISKVFGTTPAVRNLTLQVERASSSRSWARADVERRRRCASLRASSSQLPVA